MEYEIGQRVDMIINLLSEIAKKETPQTEEKEDTTSQLLVDILEQLKVNNKLLKVRQAQPEPEEMEEEDDDIDLEDDDELPPPPPPKKKRSFVR